MAKPKSRFAVLCPQRQIATRIFQLPRCPPMQWRKPPACVRYAELSMNRKVPALIFNGLRTLRFMVPKHARSERGLSMNRPHRRQVLECASPLALSTTHHFQSARGLAHSKTLPRFILSYGDPSVRGFQSTKSCSASSFRLAAPAAVPLEPPSQRLVTLPQAGSSRHWAHDRFRLCR